MPSDCSNVAVDGQRRRPVDRSDVVETEEAAREDVVAVSVFAIDPPREVQQQLVHDPLEELEVGAAVDLEDLHRRPGVDRRIDVAERPLVRGELAVGVHVPLAAHQDQLLLGEHRIDVGEGDRVECQVPRRVPRVLPLVGHRDHVVVVEVPPCRVAPVQAARRRCRLPGIAVEPPGDVVVVELLRPQHAAERLAHDHRFVRAGGRWRQCGVELVSFCGSIGKDRCGRHVSIGASLAHRRIVNSRGCARGHLELVPQRRLACPRLSGLTVSRPLTT